MFLTLSNIRRLLILVFIIPALITLIASRYFFRDTGEKPSFSVITVYSEIFNSYLYKKTGTKSEPDLLKALLKDKNDIDFSQDQFGFYKITTKHGEGEAALNYLYKKIEELYQFSECSTKPLETFNFQLKEYLLYYHLLPSVITRIDIFKQITPAPTLEETQTICKSMLRDINASYFSSPADYIDKTVKIKNMQKIFLVLACSVILGFLIFLGLTYRQSKK